MLALKRTMTLGIVVFLIVWIVLLNTGQVVDGATLPPTLVSPQNDAWVAENKPTFTWNFVDPDLNDSQSGFNLQISSEINFSTPVQNITAKSSAQNYTLTTALNDGMYYWRVRTNDTSGAWSDWNSFPWIIKIDTTSPNPVTDVSLKVLSKFKIAPRPTQAMLIGGQIINLTWTKSDDPHFLRYEVYVSTDPSVIGTRIATTTTTYYANLLIGPKGSENLPEGIRISETIYYFLEPGTTYYFSVVVVDQAGWPSDAATVSLKTTAPLNWPLIGGIAVAVEVAIAAVFVVIKLFIKKE